MHMTYSIFSKQKIFQVRLDYTNLAISFFDDGY